MRTVRLRITLREVEPTVIREIDVPKDSTLPELHHLFQAALGWTDSHLHQFVAGSTAYGVPDPEGWMEHLDESEHRLKDLPARFVYLYDFGDGWEHDVENLGTGGEGPGCISGEGNCPPEDVGGPPGYQELLEILADPQHPEFAERRQWARIRTFNLARTDLLVRQTAGQVPESVRLVLSLMKDGVKLTPGGRLPRVFLREVQQARPNWAYSRRPVSIEEDMLVLSVLGDLLRQVGLLRLRNGRLSPTKAAEDDLQVVRRLRSWWKPDDFYQVVTLLTVATLAAQGPKTVSELAASALPAVGRWAVDGRPLVVGDVQRAIRSLGSVLEGLDLVEREEGTFSAGLSARTLLPDVTGLADLWTPVDPASDQRASIG
jgi:hypothetical protein